MLRDTVCRDQFPDTGARDEVHRLQTLIVCAATVIAGQSQV